MNLYDMTCTHVHVKKSLKLRYPYNLWLHEWIFTHKDYKYTNIIVMRIRLKSMPQIS